MRGAGSAAFVAGAIGAGQAIAALGLVSLVWLNAGLLALAAVLSLMIGRETRDVSLA